MVWIAERVERSRGLGFGKGGVPGVGVAGGVEQRGGELVVGDGAAAEGV